MTSTLCGLILAGGKSARMGREKALLEIEGETLLSRTANLIRPHVTDLYVSCRQGQFPDLKIPQLHDDGEGQGPMTGILRAFEHRPDCAWLIVACDLARLQEDVITQLISKRNPKVLATAYRSSTGAPEPLCAIYEPASVPSLKSWMESGRPTPRKWLAAHSGQVELLDVPTPDALDNINTPDDIARLK